MRLPCASPVHSQAVICSCSRTLQPHLFLFTACHVKAGQEALLDYGPVSCRALQLGASITCDRCNSAWQGYNNMLRRALLCGNARPRKLGD